MFNKLNMTGFRANDSIYQSVLTDHNLNTFIRLVSRWSPCGVPF